MLGIYGMIGGIVDKSGKNVRMKERIFYGFVVLHQGRNV